MQRFVSRISNIPSSSSGKRQRDSSVESSTKKPITIKKSSVQTYLDLGQKSLGKSKRCDKCDMVFVPDDGDDCAAHIKFCQQVKQQPHIPTTSGHHIVVTYAESNESVIRVTKSQALHRSIIIDAVNLAVNDLGSSSDLVGDHDVIYLLLEGSGRVVGCLVCDQGIEAQRCATVTSVDEVSTILVGQDNKNNIVEHTKPTLKLSSDSSAFENEICFQDEKKKPALLGVKLIWVAEKLRRQGVAQKMLDSARRNLLFASVVPVDRIAFSQPTADGLAFAKAYCRSECIQAYK